MVGRDPTSELNLHPHYRLIHGECCAPSTGKDRKRWIDRAREVVLDLRSYLRSILVNRGRVRCRMVGVMTAPMSQLSRLSRRYYCPLPALQTRQRFQLSAGEQEITHIATEMSPLAGVNPGCNWICNTTWVLDGDIRS